MTRKRTSGTAKKVAGPSGTPPDTTSTRSEAPVLSSATTATVSTPSGSHTGGEEPSGLRTRIRKAIDLVIEAEDFESPVSVAYCEALFRRLRKALGDDVSLEVYHHHHTLVVRAAVGEVLVFSTVPLV